MFKVSKASSHLTRCNYLYMSVCGQSELGFSRSQGLTHWYTALRVPPPRGAVISPATISVAPLPSQSTTIKPTCSEEVILYFNFKDTRHHGKHSDNKCDRTRTTGCTGPIVPHSCARAFAFKTRTRTQTIEDGCAGPACPCLTHALVCPCTGCSFCIMILQ
jgi:hypothetical protein